MSLDQILPFAKKLLKKAIKNGDIVVDATLGNGHDTLFLAELVGETGRVYGFDIQEEAILVSKERIHQHELSNRVLLFNSGHENLYHAIPTEHHGKITSAIFNLGYLPGGDKTIVTQPNTTINAVDQLLEIMAPGGIIILVIYHGHPGGAEERDCLLQHCKHINQNIAQVLQYQFINQRNHAPFLLVIEKIKEN